MKPEENKKNPKDKKTSENDTLSKPLPQKPEKKTIPSKEEMAEANKKLDLLITKINASITE